MKNLGKFILTFIAVALMASCKKDNDNSVAVADLPAAITDYVSAHYPCSTISKAKKDSEQYTITLSPADVLDFDLTGAYIDKSLIDITTLPAAINAYVNANFPGYTIAAAKNDPLCLDGGDAYDVKITMGSSEIPLIFTPEGTFVQQEEDMEFGTLPGPVQAAVAGSYADYTHGDEAEKLILADGSIQYLVDLVKCPAEKELILAEDGSVVCESN